MIQHCDSEQNSSHFVDPVCQLRPFPTVSVAAEVAIGSVVGILLRPVEVALAAATAAADDDLDDEDSQDHVGIVLVDSIIIENFVTLFILTIVLAGSQRDGGKLSSCVEAENASSD